VGKPAEIRAAIEKLVEDHGITSILEFDSIAHEILIRKALSRGMGSRATASELGIGKSTMYRKMSQYGIK
jgi:transcriptional regulator of acetoin/glycerol metabolism